MAKRRMDMSIAEDLVYITAQAHMKAIGIYIAYKRGARKQEEVAQKAGVSAGTISNFENCESPVRRENAMAILDAVGVRNMERLYDAYMSVLALLRDGEAGYL